MSNTILCIVVNNYLQLEKEDVLIVKMDATANDVPPLFEVRG